MKAKILNFWKEEMEKINKRPWMIKLSEGDFNKANYAGFLLETYHHAGLNPQIQAFTTMFFKDNPREMISLFYKHAISEIGHDLLALSDLEKLGYNTEKLKKTKPLPSTIAYNSFPIMMVQFRNPISYLGYLFHLEYLPTQQGGKHINRLKSLGIPDEALTFLQEHASVDVSHNKLMDKYIDFFIKTDSDFDEVSYSISCSAELHYQMLSAAFDNGKNL
jgi:pyrroloquinoline quinone (PQQ) biosynthesis protein C